MESFELTQLGFARLLVGTVVALMAAAGSCSALFAGEVEIVIGGIMESEGGNWDPKNSPLTSPFGVDINREGDMWIVELEGGRVHRLDAAGRLYHEGGDGSQSYKGDGGPLALATFNGMHNCAVTPNGSVWFPKTLVQR